MIILGIETSCDETSAALVKDGRTVIADIVSSQIKIHSPFHGVVPELASRAHLINMPVVLSRALAQAGMAGPSWEKQVSAIAYTRGPGLAGSLLVGQIAAQGLAWLKNLPLVDVNHLEGHLYAALLEHPGLRPPYLSLVVSGGHTELIAVRAFGEYEFIGGTRDDAAGEAFDKVAKLLGLDYPGGPAIDKLSKKGDPASVPFPRPYLPGTWDFSFSGLKTAVVNIVKKSPPRGMKRKSDISASFQQAVVDTLVRKTVACAKQFRIRTVVLGGGVSANSCLRSSMARACKAEGLSVFLPGIRFCTDNAAMIACAGYYRFKKLGGADAAATVQRIEPGMKLSNWVAR